MLRSGQEIQGYTVRARDGNIGHIRTLYFCDQRWAIRYVVVEIGRWWRKKRVLIAPITIGQPDRETRSLSVDLTKEQVQNSPDVDTDQPVSRQQEVAFQVHYNGPAYWTMREPVAAQMLTACPGGTPAPPAVMRPELPEPIDARRTDVHLRSMREVIGYHIRATDRRVGHVKDFIVDTDAWHVRYLIVDTRNWLPGKKVLLATTWGREVNLADTQVHVDLSAEYMKNSPPYRATEAANRDAELRLYDYYGRLKYGNG
jgi:hypothetical protein